MLCITSENLVLLIRVGPRQNTNITSIQFEVVEFKKYQFYINFKEEKKGLDNST